MIVYDMNKLCVN